MRMTIQKEKQNKRVPVQPQPADKVMLAPQEGERPTVYADRVGAWYVARKSDEYRKGYGLYLTPVPAADFMAGRIHVNSAKLRILDPAAGVGILCCAAVEALVSRDPKPDTIELVAHEVDESLVAPLRTVLDYLIEWCRTGYGVTLTVRIEATDFVMAHAEALRLFGGLIPPQSGEQDFDIVISMELTRFCGHLQTVRRRCSDGENSFTLRAGVPAPDGRAGSLGPYARGAGPGVRVFRFGDSQLGASGRPGRRPS